MGWHCTMLAFVFFSVFFALSAVKFQLSPTANSCSGACNYSAKRRFAVAPVYAWYITRGVATLCP